MTVGEICTRSVVTADRNELIVEAARRMRDRHVGALVVVADSELKPVGLLTDRDIVVSAVAQSPMEIGSLQVGDVMSGDLMTALATETVNDALKRMRAHGIRRLPVVAADGRLEGILAFDDILEALSGEFAGLAGLLAREQMHEREARH